MRSKSCPDKSPSSERDTAIILAAPGPEQNGALVMLLEQLREAGYRAAVIDIDSGASDDELDSRYLDAIEAHGGAQVIGGFSLGARIAARIATRSGARALIGFAYPFHRRGDPAQTHGLASLQEVLLPTLIVQGTRDAHGSRSEIRSYGRLPGCIEVHYLEDGNHQFAPRERSRATLAGHRQEAAFVTLDFLRRTLLSTPT